MNPRSSLLENPLASTLQEKANICQWNQKVRYQRHLFPVGVKMIIQEVRCYLPDGPIYELRDIVTADTHIEKYVIIIFFFF